MPNSNHSIATIGGPRFEKIKEICFNFEKFTIERGNNEF